VKSNVLKQD